MKIKRIRIPIKTYVKTHDHFVLSIIITELQKNGYTVKDGMAIVEGFAAEIPVLVKECKEIIKKSFLNWALQM